MISKRRGFKTLNIGWVKEVPNPLGKIGSEWHTRYKPNQFDFLVHTNYEQKWKGVWGSSDEDRFNSSRRAAQGFAKISIKNIKKVRRIIAAPSPASISNYIAMAPWECSIRNFENSGFNVSPVNSFSVIGPNSASHLRQRLFGDVR